MASAPSSDSGKSPDQHQNTPLQILNQPQQTTSTNICPDATDLQNGVRVDVATQHLGSQNNDSIETTLNRATPHTEDDSPDQLQSPQLNLEGITSTTENPDDLPAQK